MLQNEEDASLLYFVGGWREARIVMLYLRESAQPERNEHLLFEWTIKEIIRGYHYPLAVKESKTLNSWDSKKIKADFEITCTSTVRCCF